MTLAAPEFPLALANALQFLRDALGANYGAETDTETLTRALGVDAVTVNGVAHPRPWATAARLIRWNTEYEVTGKLSARIDRKLQQLDAQQAQMDALAGIAEAVAAALESGSGVSQPLSGAVRTEATW